MRSVAKSGVMHSKPSEGVNRSQTRLPEAQGWGTHGMKNKEAEWSEVWGAWGEVMGKGVVMVVLCKCN